MADAKISALTNLTAADPTNDMIPIVDVSDTPPASGNTKRISINNILSSSPTASGALTVTGLVTAGSATITGAATVGTTLGVTGASTLASVGVTGAATVGTTLGVTGDLTASSDVLVNGNEKYVYLSSTYSVGTNSRVRFRAVGAGGGSGYGGDFRISTRKSDNNWNTDVLTIDSSANCIWTDGASGTRMTLNSTGLGIGVASPATKLDVAGNAALTGTSGFKYLYFNLATDTNSVRGAKIGKNYDSTFDLNIHATTAASGGSNEAAINFYRNNTDISMTLDTSGRLLVGKATSGFNTVGAEIRENGEVIQTIAASTDATIVSKVYSSTAAAYRFYVGLGGTVFATSATISAISDSRYKENVQDIDVGLAAILSLKPRKFDWKAGKGKDIKGDRGFIAQEFETVFPNLIDEWKDPAPEGEAPYKSVRQDLIPVLVKAIQELTARVQTLEAR